MVLKDSDGRTVRKLPRQQGLPFAVRVSTWMMMVLPVVFGLLHTVACLYALQTVRLWLWLLCLAAVVILVWLFWKNWQRNMKGN